MERLPTTNGAEGSHWECQLTFTAKFLWLIVRHCISPTAVDNIVTWDRAVLIAAMMDGFEVDFAWLLQEFMHERDFKVTTITLFHAWYFHYACPQVRPSGTLISSRISRSMLISASSGMRPMSWIHAEGPVHRCLDLVRMWLIL